LAYAGSITSPTKPSPTKQGFNQFRLLPGTAALLCLVTSPNYYPTTSQLIRRFSPALTFHWVIDRARIGGLPQAVLLTYGWTRSALKRDLLQRLPGETPLEEVITRERRNGPSWLRDNDEHDVCRVPFRYTASYLSKSRVISQPSRFS